MTEDSLTAQFAKIFARTHNEYVELGVGDDCAVLNFLPAGGRLVTSTDILVEGVHFKRTWSTASEIAKRAFAQNVADVEAMGARAVALVVALAVPDDASEAWQLEFAEALADAAVQQGVAVVGGDLSRAGVGETEDSAGGAAGARGGVQGATVVCVTVYGALEEGLAAVTRSGAEPGDIIAHIGDIGLSAKGYGELRGAGAGDSRAGIADSAADFAHSPTHPGGLTLPPQYYNTATPSPETTSASFCVIPEMCNSPQPVIVGDKSESEASAVGAYKVPRVPFGQGAVAARAGAKAMMDVSDGLVKDAERMARASGVLIELLPADPVRLERDGITREMYYFGGEDHGLLAAFPDAASVPEGWSVLGAVRAGKGVEGPELDTLTRDTWDHFSSDEQQEHSLYG